MPYRTTQLCLLWAIVFLSRTTHAAEVETVGGNIFVSLDDVRHQVTNLGRDSYAALSPDGKWIAFVRTDNSHAVDLNKEPAYADLYVMPSSGGSPRLLISRGTSCGKNRFLADFNSLAFLSDGIHLAFQSSWAAVHGSTHIVNISSGRCSLVAAGNRLYVVKRGEYRDHLLVSLHKYFLTTGTYDWWWLIDANGTEIGPVAEDKEGSEGDELAEFREMYERDP